MFFLNKLPSYGIQDNELDWFRDYLFQRSQLVDLQSTLSHDAPIYTGVPQGSILGPLLFILFLNDIPEHLELSKIVIYADDTVIYFPNKDIAIIENALIKDLAHLANYFDENELIINLKKGKTESMLFCTPKRLSNTNNNLTVYYRGRWGNPPSTVPPSTVPPSLTTVHRF